MARVRVLKKWWRVALYCCILHCVLTHVKSDTTEVTRDTHPAPKDEATSESTIQEKPPLELFPETEFIYWWDKVVMAILTPVLGLVGNALSFLLLSQPRLKKTPTSFYMRALAISDSVALIAGLALNHTLRLYGISLLSDVYCKMILFCTKWFGSTSDWLLACMSAERCIAIAMPLKARGILHQKANRICLAVVLFITGAYYSHIFVVFGSMYGKCVVVSERYNSNVRSAIEYCIFTLGSALIISISNTVIIIKVLNSKKKQARLSEGHGKVTDEPSKSTSSSMVAMLVSISVAYFLLKSPFLLMQSAVPSKWARSLGYLFPTHFDAQHRLMMGIFLWMLYFNHCVNFYLYVLSGREFRQEFILLFSKVAGKHNKNHQYAASQRSASTSAGPNIISA